MLVRLQAKRSPWVLRTRFRAESLNLEAVSKVCHVEGKSRRDKMKLACLLSQVFETKEG